MQKLLEFSVNLTAYLSEVWRRKSVSVPDWPSDGDSYGSKI